MNVWTARPAVRWLVAAMAMTAAGWAHAAGDLWRDRTVIGTLPFSESLDASTASEEGTDPVLNCFVGAAGSSGRATVWYQYTTGDSTEYVNISTQGSGYDTIVAVYTGAPGAFRLVAGGCNDDGVGTTQSRIAGLRLAPRTSYSIEVASHGTVTAGGSLAFAVTPAPLYVVNRQDDPSPAVSGCTAAACTLRSAISASNAVPGAVIVPAGTYTIALGASGEDANAGGDFDIRSGMSIYGAGADQTIIDANQKDRIFDIDPDGFGAPATGRVTALIADLALVNGGGSSFYGDGGAIRAYSGSSSALVNNDFVVLDHVRIRASRSQLNGGAVALSARGQFIGCEFSSNYANSTGGALTLGPSFAGGDTIIDLIDSTVEGNQSPSSFSGGGGIKSTARLRVTNSTIANNTSGYHGGGVYSTGTGTLELRSSTVARNVAASGGGTSNGGGIRLDNGTLIVANTILSGNTRGGAAGTADDCTAAAGTLTANYSLLTAASGCTFNGGNNILGVDAAFDGSIGDHGGPTRTLALASTSPAIDAADPLGCTGAGAAPLEFDQRGTGYPRSVNGRCDIGAYEASSTRPDAPGTPHLDPASDTGASSSDNVTAATSLRFMGVCDGSDVITLLVDGTPASPTDSCIAGAYDIVLGSLPPEGPHAIAATATRGGATSEPSASVLVVLDRTAPLMTITSGPAGDVMQADASFAFGTDDAITVECSIDAGAFVACSSPVAYGGLAVGPHAFRLRGTDLAGNSGEASRSWTVVAPNAPSRPLLQSGSDTGRSPSDGITNALAPVFDGTCLAGSTVRFYVDGAPTAVTTACIDGTYSSAQAVGEGTHEVAATVTAGNIESAPSTATIVVIDRTSPAAPVLASPLPQSTVAPRLAIAGSAEGDADVEVFDGNTVACSSVADGAGHWTCNAILASGQHVLSAFATDVAGNRSSASAPVTVEVDRVFADGFDGSP
ncbi:MAG: hypothetical protein GXC76_07115 [Rhodanobacteraceae bacterium]|jgi:hypothetical protein|nr:hypothetical protein [Rhodanobacteraceae bacterium]